MSWSQRSLQMPVAVIVGYDVSPFVDRNRHLHRMTCQVSVTEPDSHFDPLLSDLDIFLSVAKTKDYRYSVFELCAFSVSDLINGLMWHLNILFNSN